MKRHGCYLAARRDVLRAHPLFFVIPAPLASEARKRDQAGTHASNGLLSLKMLADGSNMLVNPCDLSVGA
jgi:hypothetical protein